MVEGMESAEHKTPFHRLRRWRITIVAAAVLMSFGAWLRCGPLPEGFLDPGPHRSVRVTDRAGRLLYESLSEREARSAWLRAEDLPQALVNATVAIEDHRFFRHPGLDPVAIARAVLVDLRAMKLKEGGSTLTQQAVKRLMARRRTVGGKVREMVYALRLEHRLSKLDILALNLNVAPYGNQYEGIQAASMGYFGCPVANLTVAQAALLAGLPQRPSSLDPYRNLKGAMARQREVLRRMRSLGLLEEEVYRRAKEERLVLRKADRPLLAPHFVQRVIALQGGAAGDLRTTLDLDLQREVQGVIESKRAELDRHGAHSVAVAVMDNATGEWLAWEGSGCFSDPDHGGAIDGVITPRQPGSALKPFTYALAFQRGFTPASILPDIPSHFATAEEGILYSPRNYDGIFRGPMRARLALAGSENVPAVWLLSQVGVPSLLDELRSMGFTTLEKTADFYGYGLTLGDPEVRLDEMVAAYACLARGGVYVAPRAVMSLQSGAGSGGREGINETTSQRSNENGGPRAQETMAEIGGAGDRLPTPHSSLLTPHPALSRLAAFWVTDILSDNEARAFVFGRGGSLEFPFAVAAKTGTSQAYRDNWTLGYTREVTVGVWVGNFDSAPLKRSSGVTGAGPIFHDVMLAAQRRALGRMPSPMDPPIGDQPAGLAPVRICALSGQKESPDCPSSVQELLPVDEIPPVCRWHFREGGAVVTAWPPEYQSWARGRGDMSSSSSEPAPARSLDHRSRGLAIENPPDGATYWIDPTLRPEFQSLEFRALAADPRSPLSWMLDGVPLGERAAGRPLRWPLSAGLHRLVVSDRAGHKAEVKFTVK